jgi:hypothetical protein
MIGYGGGDNQDGLLIHRNLHVEVLVKSLVAAIFHDARFWIGKIRPVRNIN